MLDAPAAPSPVPHLPRQRGFWRRIADRMAAYLRAPRPAVPPERSVAFTIAVIALGAKLAKVDGEVVRSEVAAFRRIFVIPRAEEKNAARVFDLARETPAGFDAWAGRIAAMFPAGDPVLEDVIEGLCVIGVADGALQAEERAFIDEVGRIFGIPPETLAAMDERTLPMYTILVPVYREAAVIPYLVAGIESLDYPKTKLDVRLLCEEDDEETIQAIMDLDLPPHFNAIVVPPSQPQTKPKACNFGLLGAKGEYVVIYDAEDRPDPLQLKKAVHMFENVDDSIVCIQAKLNFFNQQTNILTRWFSIEYSQLFDLVLPGLDARRDPIPLGGTSNHIKRDELVEVGGWDPYNVTEDADLGVRLHQAGYRTTMMDSTTYEEANTSIPNWIRQRSRWIKGYLQTWLVYMRNPFRFLSNVGFKGFVSFQLLIGGTFMFLINPIFWFLTTLFALTQLHVIQDFFPGWVYFLAASQLFLGNFVFVYLGLSASVRRGDYSLATYALFLPFYWGLMSVAAWKGFGQLVTNPFYWEKTEHGLDLGGGAEHAHTTTPKKAGAA